MTLEAIEHPTSASSRPASPRPSSESYTAHLRNISRLSLDLELLNISPASLSPPSTPRPGSSACHPGHRSTPALITVHEPYKPAPAMVSRPSSHPPTERSSGRNTPIEITLSPPVSQPHTPTTPTPTEAPHLASEKPPMVISPSTRPPPRRGYQPDPFEHRTRWSRSRPKHKADSGYCCGLCDEPPETLALCGSWLTGTMTALLAGASMACCAAALR
jgi:hypothetical protein